MSGEILKARLNDGLPVLLRPLTQRDRGALAEGYRRLSPDSRYQRFWVHTGEVMGDKMLDRILRQDPDNHAVWAVLDRTREFPGMGAASFWRSEDDPEEAEFSCTVQDADQRRGLGTLLMATVWLAALRVGIRRFTGYTMPENLSAIRWMRDTGAEAEWDGYKVIFRWRLDDLEAIPATPAGIALAGRLSELSSEMLPD